MADADVVGVRFRDAVRFNNTEHRSIYKEANIPGSAPFVITKVSGGVSIARPTGGRSVFVPFNNILYLEMGDEPAKGKA